MASSSNNNFPPVFHLLPLPFLLLLVGTTLTAPAPSSPWNQAGLNLIFKPDVNRLRQANYNANHLHGIHSHNTIDYNTTNAQRSENFHINQPYDPTHTNGNGNSIHSSDSNSNSNSNTNAITKLSSEGGNSADSTKNKGNKLGKIRTGSHSWGYTRYGQDIGHIRHMSNRSNGKHLLPSNRIVPCPRDYIQTYNGKCRRIPKFSPSRVG